jgi:hypothetical protein
MTDIKERPILFSAPMVRAILDGRKTVTRRTIKPMRGYEDCDTCRPDNAAASHSVWWHGRLEAVGVMQDCPYGKPGDRLWVRETWYCNHFDVQKGPYLQPAEIVDLDQSREDGELVYAADGLTPYEQEQPTWKPSIHMPRWACRILLEITDVRVERLQDITSAQVTAEGVSTHGEALWGGEWWVDAPDQAIEDARKDFADLWTSTGGNWDANPWVWVVEFKRVTP